MLWYNLFSRGHMIKLEEFKALFNSSLVTPYTVNENRAMFIAIINMIICTKPSSQWYKVMIEHKTFKPKAQWRIKIYLQVASCTFWRRDSCQWMHIRSLPTLHNGLAHNLEVGVCLVVPSVRIMPDSFAVFSLGKYGLCGGHFGGGLFLVNRGLTG